MGIQLDESLHDEPQDLFAAVRDVARHLQEGRDVADLDVGWGVVGGKPFISPFQVNLMGHFKQVIVIGLLGGCLPPWLFGCHQGHL